MLMCHSNSGTYKEGKTLRVECEKMLRDANRNQIRCCLSLVCKTVFDSKRNEERFAHFPCHSLPADFDLHVAC